MGTQTVGTVGIFGDKESCSKLRKVGADYNGVCEVGYKIPMIKKYPFYIATNNKLKLTLNSRLQEIKIPNKVILSNATRETIYSVPVIVLNMYSNTLTL